MLIGIPPTGKVVRINLKGDDDDSFHKRTYEYAAKLNFNFQISIFNFLLSHPSLHHNPGSNKSKPGECRPENLFPNGNVDDDQ